MNPISFIAIMLILLFGSLTISTVMVLLWIWFKDRSDKNDER